MYVADWLLHWKYTPIVHALCTVFDLQKDGGKCIMGRVSYFHPISLIHKSIKVENNEKAPGELKILLCFYQNSIQKCCFCGFFIPSKQASKALFP